MATNYRYKRNQPTICEYQLGSHVSLKNPFVKVFYVNYKLSNCPTVWIVLIKFKTLKQITWKHSTNYFRVESGVMKDV